MSTNKIVTGLHAFYCLILVASYVPSLNADDGVTCVVSCCAEAVAEATGPAFIVLAEVCISEEVADVGTCDVTAGDCISEPLGHALCLCCDFLSSCCVNVNDVLVCAKSIGSVGLLNLREVLLESCALCTCKVVMLCEVSLYSFALCDVCCINSCVSLSSFSCCIECCESSSKIFERACFCHSFDCCRPCVNQRLSSSDVVDGCLLGILYLRGNV